MIRIERSKDGVIVLKVEGRLEKEELEQATTLVERSIAENEKTHIYADIEGFAGFDLSALPNYLPRAAAMLGKLSRFGRIAVVADQSWVRWATRIESAILPHIRYETYVPAEKAQALDWVEGRSDRSRAPSLKIIETNRPDVIGFELDGKMTAGDVDAATGFFESAFKQEGALRLLGRILRVGGVESIAMFDSAFLQMKLKALKRVDRYALVGGPPWLRAWAAVLDPMVNTDIRHYALEDEASAWAWLEAEPKSERALAA